MTPQCPAKKPKPPGCNDLGQTYTPDLGTMRDVFTLETFGQCHFFKRRLKLSPPAENTRLFVLQVMDELLLSRCVATMRPASKRWTSRLTRTAPNGFMHCFSTLRMQNDAGS